MAEQAGQLGGVFSEVEGNACRFLVTTFWRDVSSHDRYSRNAVPMLREKADVQSDVRSIVGRTVRLVPEWCVMGPSTARNESA